MEKTKFRLSRKQQLFYDRLALRMSLARELPLFLQSEFGCSLSVSDSHPVAGFTVVAAGWSGAISTRWHGLGEYRHPYVHGQLNNIAVYLATSDKHWFGSPHIRILSSKSASWTIGLREFTPEPANNTSFLRGIGIVTLALIESLHLPDIDRIRKAYFNGGI